MKLSREADEWQTQLVWENRKLEAYMSSPVVIDGNGYLLLKNQRFCCFDLETGKERWRSKKSFGKYWSLVTQGDRILALDETGDLRMIRANSEQLEIIDQRKISNSPTWAHLAAAGEHLFVRELDALVAYRWK